MSPRKSGQSRMTQSNDGFLEAFKQGLKEAKKQRKTDDILEFMKKNWKLFCSSKAEMDSLVDEMYQQGGGSVDRLADMLGLPETVLFKKVKLVDTADMLLNLMKSPMYKLFLGQREKSPHLAHGLCIFFVAGDHTLVMTDMSTERVPGLVHISIPDEDLGGSLEVFKASEAPLRLPRLFNHKELE